MTKIMSYEGVCPIARVMLIADMSCARDGRAIYITVDSILVVPGVSDGQI